MIFNFKTTIISKIKIADGVYEFKLSAPEDFNFIPGQFITLLFYDKYPRAYSIVDKNRNEITLIIDTAPMGIASQFFEKECTGEELTAKGPFGIFTLKNINSKKVFIATSTGIAPFIPMIKEALKVTNNDVHLFFGVRYLKDDFAKSYFGDLSTINLEYHLCISREIPKSESFQNNVSFDLGRVTSVIQNQTLDFQNTEFYLCGSKQMVSDTSEILKQKKALKIFTEKF